MITVSIIDDDAGVRESIASYINAARDLRCISTFSNAQEALENLPAKKPDVLLMDINMPEMNGIECARKLSTAMPSINILMLTVFDDSDKIFQALAAGASGYLLKRSQPSKLLAAIREVHGGGAPMSATIARKVVRSFRHAAETGSKNEGLSPREEQVLDCLAKGYVYKQISEELHISIDTIRTYIRRIYDKLHVHSRTEAVAKYLGS